MSFFGRGGGGGVFWFDTQRSGFLKEVYQREFKERGLSIDESPATGMRKKTDPETLAKMSPEPYRRVITWPSRLDVDEYNFDVLENPQVSPRCRFDVTPKVGDGLDSPFSPTKLQRAMVENYESSLKPGIGAKTLSSSSVANRRHQSSGAARLAQSAELGVLSSSRSISTPTSLPPPDHTVWTTYSRNFADPTEFVGMAGTLDKKYFRPKTFRQEYQERRIRLANMAANK